MAQVVDCMPSMYETKFNLQYQTPSPLQKKKKKAGADGTHTCDPSYLGGCDGEDQVSRPPQANSSWDPISQKTRVKWTGGMAQAVEYLLCKCKVLRSNPSQTKKKKKRKKESYKDPEPMNTWSCRPGTSPLTSLCPCWHRVLAEQCLMSSTALTHPTLTYKVLCALPLSTSPASVLMVQPLNTLHLGTSQTCHASPHHRAFAWVVSSP
jgi:hypothetical protein